MADSKKHTPGPWSISDETIRDGLRSKLIHGATDGMLAIVRVEHQGRHYGDANARLIAAAPDLIDAARNTVDGLAEEYLITADRDDEWIYDTLGSVVSGIYFSARAAIARAEGRS